MDYTEDASQAELHSDEYVRGWLEADVAIEQQLPGCTTLSQGTSPWDKGWNARIELEGE